MSMPTRAAVLDDIGWQRYSLAAKVVEWGVMTHLGRQYGLLNQLLNLLFCLVAIGAIAAGLRLWWLRRQPGRWLPPRQHTDRLPRALQLCLLMLALLFPLLWLALGVVRVVVVAAKTRCCALTVRAQRYVLAWRMRCF